MENEKGMTLVEVLATLLLMSLVTGVIWTTISIATKFNVSETSTLTLQQETNYIIAELQQVHRHCKTYELTISKNEIKVDNCIKNNPDSPRQFNGVISNRFNYSPEMKNVKYKPSLIIKNKEDLVYKNDINIPDFEIIDPVNDKRRLNIPISVYRLKTGGETGGE